MTGEQGFENTIRANRSGFFFLLPLLAAVIVLLGCGGGGGSSGGGGAGGTGGGGGGTPAPVITILSPSKITIPVPQGIVSVFGRNFTSAAKVLIDGAPVTTRFIDSGALECTINFSLTTTPGTHQVTVQDAGGTSNALPLSFYLAGQGPQTFLAPAGYFAARFADPSGIAVADFNKDGVGDVIISGNITGTTTSRLAILKGRRDGTLDPPQILNLNDLAYGPLAAGDLNGDGWADLVQISYTQNPASVLVMSNDGRGNLQQTSSLTIPGIFPSLPILADMNGDAKLDLVISEKDPTAIYVVNNVGGAFGSPVQVASISANNRSFSVADLNGDGRPDILYTGVDAGTGQDQLRLLLNMGNGSFSDTLPVGLGGVSGRITTADLNHDGLADLAVQSMSTSFNIVLQVYLNLGNAAFSLASTRTIAPAGFASYILVAGDFDNDGQMDLGGINGETHPAHILYLWGDGLGNFTPQQVNGPMGAYITSGDVNGDGIPDVVVPDRFIAVSVSLGRRDRNFPSPVSLAPFNAGGLSAADVDGDGLPDLFVNGNSVVRIPGTIFLNKGNGVFQLSASVTPDALMIADLDGDGRAELIGAGSTLLIWPGTGDPTFSGAPVPVTVSFPIFDLKIADLDKDGQLDLVLVGTNFSGTILYGKGNFRFDSVQVPFQGPIVVGDFNGDGFGDIASPVVTFLGSANRTFQSVRTDLNLSAVSGHIPVGGDFNGDGKLDIAFLNDNIVEIEYGRGDGTFFLQGAVALEDRGGAITVSDYNGDGLQDIAVGLLFAHQMVILTNDGQGGFLKTYYASGVQAVSMVQADFNKDMKPDLALTNFGLNFRPPNVVVIFHK